MWIVIIGGEIFNEILRRVRNEMANGQVLPVLRSNSPKDNPNEQPLTSKGLAGRRGCSRRSTQCAGEINLLWLFLVCIAVLQWPSGKF